MKRFLVLFVALTIAFAAIAVAQAPPAAAGRGGQRGPQVPPASGPMLDMANKIAELINKQDAAGLGKLMAPDAVYLDEDGHAPAVARWITALTTGTPPKKIEISATHSQMWDNVGWVSFNYVLAETFQNNPKNLRGTASLVLKKAATGEWQIQLIHGALYQKVAGLPEGQ